MNQGVKKLTPTASKKVNTANKPIKRPKLRTVCESSSSCSASTCSVTASYLLL
jgi:lipoate synthase